MSRRGSAATGPACPLSASHRLKKKQVTKHGGECLASLLLRLRGRKLTHVTDRQPIGALGLLTPAAHSGEGPVHKASGISVRRGREVGRRLLSLAPTRLSLETLGLQEKHCWALNVQQGQLPDGITGALPGA